MHPRLFRLIETHQRIDRDLRSEQGRSYPDSFRLMRLKQLKLRAKELIHRFHRRPQHA